MKCAGGVPIVSCGDWSIDEEVVWLIIVNALLRSPMLRDDEGAFDIEVVGDDVFEVESHCF